MIVRHPSEPAIALVADDRGVRLPAFVADDRHTAEVDYINRAARERFGLSTTILRSLRHSDPRDAIVDRVHELQALPDGAAARARVVWCRHDDAMSRLEGVDRDAVAEWLATEPASVVVDGREWIRPGWLAEASEWIVRALADTGPVSEIVQLRAWASSCVLLVRALGQEFYFKAVADSMRHEVAVTAYLSRHFPGAVARVVAAWPERRWFLMARLAGRPLEGMGDGRAWERAAASYGRLQAACTASVADLRACGCPTRTLDELAAAVERLAADEALRSSGPGALSAAEVGRLRALVPELQERCARLDARGIPPTLEHGDLWPGNFLVDGDSCALIDWEDVAVGHPFLSLAPLVVGLGEHQPRLASPGMTNRLERRYAAAFAGLASPEQLIETLRLARPLSFFDMAVRYRALRPSVVRLHPWMRDLVPQSVRLALAQLEPLDAET